MATILVVDDRAVNRKLLKDLLVRTDHRLLEAENGADALVLARLEHPDLVVADILMPKMDGYEFVRELRQDSATRECAVIFWTANYAEDEVQLLADRSGVKHVLLKPTEPGRILDAIENALSAAPQDISPVPDEVFRREHLAILNDKLLEQVRKLDESEQLFRAVVENASDLVMVLELDGTARYVSPSIERVLGFRATEIVGKDALALIHPADISGTSVALAHVAKEPRKRVSLEIRARRADGTWRVIEFDAVNLSHLPGVGGVLVVARDITERKRAEEERRTLLAHLVKAQEEERKRIASDVHDDSIQVMAAVGVRLGMLRGHLADEEQVARITKLEDAVQQAIGRLRQLLFQLAPPALERDGLTAAMRFYLEEAFGDEGTHFHLESEYGAEPPREIRVLVYRIAQEALSNVRKHAQARNVGVWLTERDGGLLIQIRDDGVGFTSGDVEMPLPGHLGLVSMRERAEMLGGWLAVESEPGKGTSVEFWIPRVIEA